MPQIFGFHHVSLPASDPDRSSDWYERVFGFERLLIEEEEDRVTMIMLEHPGGMRLCLHLVQSLDAEWSGQGKVAAVLSFRVASHADLLQWDEQLTELGIEHSSPRQAHLGWALDVTDPAGLRIQLHTAEPISVDDA